LSLNEFRLNFKQFNRNVLPKIINDNTNEFRLKTVHEVHCTTVKKKL